MSHDHDPTDDVRHVPGASVTTPLDVPLAPQTLLSDADDEDDEPTGAGGSPAGQRRGPVPHHILEAVALMVVNGATYDAISISTGLPTDRIQRLVARNQSLQHKIDSYRNKILRASAHHQIKLIDLLEHSYKAIERALTQLDDAELAKDTAFEVMDRVIPRAKSEAGVELNVGFQNVHLQASVTNTFKRLGDNFETILGRLVEHERDPDRYIRTDVPHYHLTTSTNGTLDDLDVDTGAPGDTGPSDGTPVS